jgi:hypothetical protein
VQLEGTDQLEISLPDRHRNKSGNNTASLKNGGSKVAKSVRTPGDKDQPSLHFEENIPLTTPKNSCHNINHNNSNASSSAYVSLQHEQNSADIELI